MEIMLLTQQNTVLRMKLAMEQMFSGRGDPKELIDTAFRSIDVNGDEVVDLDEFGDLCEELNLSLTSEEVESIFKECDQDGNGVLDIKEVEESLMPKLSKQFTNTGLLGDAETKIHDLEKQLEMKDMKLQKAYKNEHHMKLRHERDVERTKRTKDREIERLQAQMELQKEELQAKLMKSESTSGRMRKKLEDLEDEMDNLRHTEELKRGGCLNLQLDTSETGAESRFLSVAQDEIFISICDRGIWTPVEAE